MVHITYRHVQDSNEEKCVILKESHFDISEDQTHDIHYVQHCFKMFYDHIAVDIPFFRHLFWSNGCVGQLKNARVTSTCHQFCHVSFTFVEKSRVNYAFLQFF